MKIGIIGLGFVGSAINEVLKLKKISNIKIYDKFKNGGIGKLEDCFDTDFIFLCLPTEYDQERKDYNLDPINENLNLLNRNSYDGIIIIKSTVLPGTTEKLSNKFENLNLCHNPEFLTARTATKDFLNQKHIILGKTKNSKSFDYLKKFYEENWLNAVISVCSSKESESIKIFCNSFYAVKIQFFNELFLLCKKQNIDFKNVTNLMIGNGWINPMHTDVPGHDGKLSYGGACFPKDTNALLSHLIKNGVPNNVLDATVQERNIMRNNTVDSYLNNSNNV